MLTDEQAQNLIARVKSGAVPDSDLDVADELLKEWRAKPKGETQADLEAKFHTTPATGLNDPGYPATGQQALEAESFSKAAAAMHNKLPAVRQAPVINPALKNASKRVDLDAPAEYHPPTTTAAATDPLHPLDQFSSLIGQTKDAMPWPIGNVRHYFEPPQLPHEPLDVYHERADKMWQQKLAEAQQTGTPIVRVEYAKPNGVGEQLVNDVEMAAGQLASMGYGAEENAGGPVRALERSFDPEAAKNTDAVIGRFPAEHTAGMVAGAMSPLAPGNTLGRVVPELGGISGGIATGMGRGAIAAGTVQGLHDTLGGNYEGMGGRIGTAAVAGGTAGGVLGGIGGAARAHGEALDLSNPNYAEARARGLLDDRTMFGGIRPDENIQAFRGKAIPGSTAEQVAGTEIAPDILETARATKAGEIARVSGAKERFYAEHPQQIAPTEIADAARNQAIQLSDESGAALPGEVNARDLARHQKLLSTLKKPEVTTVGEPGAGEFFHQESSPEGPVDNYRRFYLKHQLGASDADIAGMSNDQAQKLMDEASNLEIEPSKGPVIQANRQFLQARGVPDAAIDSMSNGEAKDFINRMVHPEGATVPDVHPHANTEPAPSLAPASPASGDGAPPVSPSDQAKGQELGRQFKETYSLKGARRVLGHGLDPALKEAGIPGAGPEDVAMNTRVKLTDRTFTPKQYEDIVAGLQDPRQGNIRGLGEIQAAGHAGRERITGTTADMPEGYSKFIAGEHEKMTSLEQLYGDAGIPLVDKSGKAGIPSYSELSSDQRNHLINTIIKNAHGGLPEQVSNAQKIASQADVGKQFNAIHENALVSDLEDQMRFHIRPGLSGIHLTGSPSNVDALRLRLDPALRGIGKMRGGAAGNLAPITLEDIQRLQNPMGGPRANAKPF